MQPFIRVDHITHHFHHRQQGTDAVVMKDVSFDVEEGTFLSVVGPSGCGKTTLLRIIHGLIAPTSGSVSIGGRLVSGPEQTRAMVFQDFRLFPWRSVLDNVGFGLELRGVNRGERGAKSRALLQLVGLEGYERHYVHELSGGMKQRVALARALAIEPQVLLMDEPFGALDAQTREVMQTELLRVWEATKATVIFITHSIDEAVFLSDSVLILSARPSSVKERMSIALPRPRTADRARHSQEFLDYRRTLWASLASELRT